MTDKSTILSELQNVKLITALALYDDVHRLSYLCGKFFPK